jgi:ABC-type polysaccharide/polyol phosphate export permease
MNAAMIRPIAMPIMALIPNSPRSHFISVRVIDDMCLAALHLIAALLLIAALFFIEGLQVFYLMFEEIAYLVKNYIC